MENILSLSFIKLIEAVEIKAKLRVSIWLEEYDKYLMPSEFIEVSIEDDYYRVKVRVIDPDNFISKNLIGKKFLFGHPGKIIGYGVLETCILCPEETE